MTAHASSVLLISIMFDTDQAAPAQEARFAAPIGILPKRFGGMPTFLPGLQGSIVSPPHLGVNVVFRGSVWPPR